MMQRCDPKLAVPFFLENCVGSTGVVFEILTASSGDTIGASLEAESMDFVLFRSQCFETSIYYSHLLAFMHDSGPH